MKKNNCDTFDNYLENAKANLNAYVTALKGNDTSYIEKKLANGLAYVRAAELMRRTGRLSGVSRMFKKSDIGLGPVCRTLDAWEKNEANLTAVMETLLTSAKRDGFAKSSLNRLSETVDELAKKLDDKMSAKETTLGKAIENAKDAYKTRKNNRQHKIDQKFEPAVSFVTGPDKDKTVAEKVLLPFKKFVRWSSGIFVMGSKYVTKAAGGIYDILHEKISSEESIQEIKKAAAKEAQEIDKLFTTKMKEIRDHYSSKLGELKKNIDPGVKTVTEEQK